LLGIFLIFTLFLKAEPLITWSFFIGHIIYFLLLLYYQGKLGYRFSLKIDKSEKKSIYRISFPQFLSAVFNQSQKWSDTILLGILGTSTQVGIYYIGLRIGGFISIPANAMNTIFMPIAARLIGQKNNAELNDLYKTVTRIIFVCGSLGFGIVFFLRTYLIDLFGKGYESAGTIILVLLISETIDFGVGPARQLITMSGGGRINLINSILTLTIDITASFLLIPRYGIMGAAFANGLTNIVLQIVTVLELMFIYKLSPFNKEYFIEVGLFLFCFLGTVFLPFPDLVKLAIFLIVLSALYLAVVLGKKERAKIKNLLTQKRKKKKVRFEVDQEA
jgi:O-antigen/teichoic acid export membrane protein